MIVGADTQKHKWCTPGFTLLEMAIVLVILAVVVVGVATMFTVSVEKRQAQETQFKLDTIRKTLYEYRVAFNRLPCPADITKPMGNSSFGVEAANPGDCQTGSPAANFGGGVALSATAFDSIDGGAHYTISNIVSGSTSGIRIGDTVSTPVGVCTGVLVTAVDASSITIFDWRNGWENCRPVSTPLPYIWYFGGAPSVEGMVPVRALSLPDDFAIDGWGRRIFYAVSKDMTLANAFNAISLADNTPRMNILSPQQNAKVTKALYVLISTGRNGHGGFFRDANSLTSRVNAGSTNADELQNCDCDASALATPMNNSYTQRDVLQTPGNRQNTHDDYVVFGTRLDFALPGFMRVLPSVGNEGNGGGGHECNPGCAWNGTQCDCGGGY